MNLAEQTAHYKAIRERIAAASYKPLQKPVQIEAQPKPIEAPQQIELPPIKLNRSTRESLAYLLQAYGVTWDEVTSVRRWPRFTRARRAIWWFLHCRGFSTVRIGELTNRDHTSVVHALQKVNSWKVKVRK
jgi:tRNA nucleotidyltransferase (CCA-adding enzyme)